MTQGLIIEIPAELFAPAESSLYEGTIEVEPFDFGPDSYTAAYPFTWNVTVSNVGGAFLITGSVSGGVVTSCARCLEAASFEIQGEVEGYFIIEGEGEPPDDREKDEFDMLPEDNRIDLYPLIMAAIFVELPLIPLCREDCAGICLRCGANLNKSSCDCNCTSEDLQHENDINPNNPFAALKNLTFD